MIDNIDDDYIIRNATINDKFFIADVIIEAEKSGTENCGLAKIYNISEKDLREYLIQMLEEEIDGCEISINNFLIFEYKGEPVAAAGGWKEGDNEEGMPSAILKANLFAYYLPQSSIVESKSHLNIVKDIQIQRQWGTYQLEYAYVKKEHEGNFLYVRIINELLVRAKCQYPDLEKAQIHVFENNKVVTILLKMMGFKITSRFISKNEETKSFFPDSKILLMEKELK